MSSVVVLDACVLFPHTLRDTLLRIAERELYKARWTDEIIEEMRRNLIKTNQANESKVQRLIEQMNQAFKYAPVANYASLIPTMTNNPKDRHVAAAAVACNAQRIVTFNLRHFPSSALSPFQITVQSPDDFLCDLLSGHPEQIQHIMQSQAQEYHKPPLTLTALLNILAKSAPQFVNLLRQNLDLPPA